MANAITPATESLPLTPAKSDALVVAPEDIAEAGIAYYGHDSWNTMPSFCIDNTRDGIARALKSYAFRHNNSQANSNVGEVTKEDITDAGIALFGRQRWEEMTPGHLDKAKCALTRALKSYASGYNVSKVTPKAEGKRRRTP